MRETIVIRSMEVLYDYRGLDVRNKMDDRRKLWKCSLT